MEPTPRRAGGGSGARGGAVPRRGEGRGGGGSPRRGEEGEAGGGRDPRGEGRERAFVSLAVTPILFARGPTGIAVLTNPRQFSRFFIIP